MSDEKTKAEVMAAVIEGLKSWCAGDVERWRKVIHPEIYGYYFTGGLLGESGTGDEVYESYRSVCESGRKSSLSPSHVAIRLVGTDAAIATLYIQAKETVPGVHTVEGTWRATAVLTRADGSWRWIHYHYSPLVTSQSARMEM